MFSLPDDLTTAWEALGQEGIDQFVCVCVDLWLRTTALFALSSFFKQSFDDIIH